MKSGFSYDVDGEVLVRAKQGDVAAMSQIYRQFSAPVYTLGLRICPGNADAEDVVQDTFIDAFRKLDQYRGDAPFWAWLKRVAINTALMRLRKERRWDRALEEVNSDDLNNHAAVRANDPSNAMDAEKKLSQLPAVTRTVLWLHDVEGYTHREIAGMMGKTESFSKSQLSRGHEKMRVLLQWKTTKTGNTRTQQNC